MKQAEFFNQDTSEVVVVSDRIKRPRTNYRVNFLEAHITEYQGQKIRITPYPGEVFDFGVGWYFRYFEEGPPFQPIFSGYVKNMFRKIKTGDIEVEIEPDVEYFKSVSIPDTIPAGTYLERINFAKPDSHIAFGVDQVAIDALNKQSHTLSYDGGSFADLLFDTILMMNALNFNPIVVAVVRHWIMFFSGYDHHTLTASMLEDINIGEEQKEISFYDAHQIGDKLRGTGYVAPFIRPIIGKLYLQESEVITTEELRIFTNVDYNGENYGFVTARQENDNGMLKYTAIKRIFVPGS